MGIQKKYLTYDNMNQLTRMETKLGSEAVGVDYTYDYFGNVKTIGQNGTKYEIGYDLNSNVTNIGVEGQTPLVRYTYTAGGNVKTAEYPDGDKMTCTYDRYGNMIGESWKSGSTTQAEYSYTYDKEKNLQKTIDKSNEIMYNYKYESGNLVETEEYAVELAADGATINKKTLKNRIEYHYKDGQIKQKVEVYVKDGTESSKIYDYSYLEDEDGKYTLKLPTNAKSVAGVDHFGRKTFDELQLGTGFIGRTYGYESGSYDSEKLNGKLQSIPETDLVNKITYYNGKELRYTYNEAGDITRVRDESGNLLEAYGYDELGRLKTEQNVKGQYYTVYEYDAGGNIQSKTKYYCASTTAITSPTGTGAKYTYTYDSVWKDRLTGYTGYSSMTYVGGNPTTYKGLSAQWEKGRRLKQLGTNAYTYNSSGVRIGKTVNGIEHKYTIEGTNILREEYGEHVLDYLYGVDGEIVGFTYDGTAYYYEKNLQGDVIWLTDASGNEIAKYTYDAWGKVLSVEGNTAIANVNPIRYRSYYYDTETLLYYLQSRYYDPETGRFINADDATLIQKNRSIHKNQFSYCNNTPILSKDIFGYWVLSLQAEVQAAFLIGITGYLGFYIDNHLDMIFAWGGGLIATTNIYASLSIGWGFSSNNSVNSILGKGLSVFGGFTYGTSILFELDLSSYLSKEKAQAQFNAGLSLGWAASILPVTLGGKYVYTKKIWSGNLQKILDKWFYSKTLRIFGIKVAEIKKKKGYVEISIRNRTYRLSVTRKKLKIV